jgi:hypothetical protein
MLTTKLIKALLLVFAVSSISYAAIAVDSEMPSDTGESGGNGVTSTNYSFTNTAGTFLVCGVVLGDGDETDSIDSITYAGASLGAADTSIRVYNNTFGRISIYHSTSPATGSNTLAITSSGNSGSIISGCISFTGVDLENPIIQSATNHDAGSPGTTASVDVTGTTPESVIVDLAGAGASFSANANTLTWRRNVDSGMYVNNGDSTYASGTGGTVTMSHTIGASDYWGAVAVELRPLGAITFDSATSEQEDSADTSLSWTHTTALGSSRILVAGVSYHSDAAIISGITYNGDAMTHIRASTNTSPSPDGRVEMWYLVNPDTGTNSVSVTFSANVTQKVGGAVSLMGARQSSQPDNSNDANGTSTTPSVSVTTIADNAWIIDAFGVYQASVTQTAGASQTERWSENISATLDLTGAGSTEGPVTTPGATTMDWTIGASEYWSTIAVSIAPATAFKDQEGFAFGDDDGNEASHTLGSQDADLTAVLGTKTLRTLVNITGSGSNLIPSIRYQKNGSGGYVAVSTSSAADYNTGAVENGDLTKSGNNTASTSWAVSVPATGIGDLVIINMNWDDSTTTTDVTMSLGKNGETANALIGPIASLGTATRSKAWYFITTSSWSASTIISTPTASEQWTATVIKVPAGEFNSSTPIGVSASTANVATTNEPCCPGFTTGSSDARSRVICYLATDVDDADGTATGWTALTSTDRGAVGDEVDTRDTLASNSELIPYTCGWTIPAVTKNWTSLTYTIKPPTSVINQIYISTSANVTASGEATTYRLSAPSGKTTDDFDTGRRWDDENGTDAVTIGDDEYTEYEWVITTQSPATTDDYFEFRTYLDGNPSDSYTLTPKWTIGTGGEPPGRTDRNRIWFLN